MTAEGLSRHGGGWLTEQRVDRLAVLTAALNKRGGWTMEESTRRGWEHCGGPVREVEQLLGMLRAVGLVRRQDGRHLLTKAGEKVSTAHRRGDRTAVPLVLLRAGAFHEQARLLLETAAIGADGVLRCSATAARSTAPQLVGILRRWPHVRAQPVLAVPVELVKELSSASSLLPVLDIPAWSKDRKLVGDRAEYYSYMTERMHDPAQVFWVARENDALGYDIEDRRLAPARRIEVKGSRSKDVSFFLSSNEWEKAETYGDLYEVQFWGEIDLDRTPADEYLTLQARGWPFIIRDPALALQSEDWVIVANGWKVTRT